MATKAAKGALDGAKTTAYLAHKGTQKAAKKLAEAGVDVAQAQLKAQAAEQAVTDVENKIRQGKSGSSMARGLDGSRMNISIDPSSLETALLDLEAESEKAKKELQAAEDAIVDAEEDLEKAEEIEVEAKVEVSLLEAQVNQLNVVPMVGGAPTSTVPPEISTLAPSSTVPPEITNVAPSATTLQGSNQAGLFDGKGLDGGQGVVVTGVAVKGVSVGFYTADGHKVLACKWSTSSGVLSANSKIGGKWGKSLKADGAPLTPGDEFTVTITASEDSAFVVIDAVNNTTGKATKLQWPMNVEDVKYIRSYKDGVMAALHPKVVDPNTFVSWLRTAGKCVDATGKDVDVHAITTGMPNEYECLDWCEAQHGTTGCEWYQAKKRCTAHKDASVVRGTGGTDNDSKYVCHVPPPKCACKVNSVQEKSWDATE